MSKMNFAGLDPVLRLNNKLGIPLTNSADLHPVLRIAGIVSQPGEILDYALKMKPIAPRRHKAPQIVMVGCGGTGSHLLPNILQYIGSCKLKSPGTYQDPSILLIDGDSVEEKNLVRQRFTQKDVGENKASALGRRYGSIFGIKLQSVEGYITSSKELLKLMNLHDEQELILIGTVDNNRARAVLWDTFMTHKGPSYWIDSGNDKWHGQVILGCRNVTTVRSARHWTGAGIGQEIKGVDLPTFFDEYPEEFLVIGGTPETPVTDCAQQVAEDPQTIQANMMSAFCATHMVMQVLARDIRTIRMSFDAQTGNSKATSLTRINVAEGITQMQNSRKQIFGFFNNLVEVGKKSQGSKYLPGIYNSFSNNYGVLNA